MSEGRALSKLEASFAGELVQPGNAAYDERRAVWNGSIDRRPALIARCTGAADVSAAVTFARRTGLPLAVRSGGHSFPGHSVCDDGVVVDLGPMKGIDVDPEARTARAEGGVLLGELDRETQALGLAVPAGIVTHTGLAGLTLGGGIGWLQRKHGLTIDQLLSVDLITAEGELVKASETENPDLFWGIRGGGGNFGVVTQFEFRLNPLGPQVVAGPVFWPIEESPNVLRFYRDWIAAAPDDLMTIVIHRKAPPLPFVPSELHGKPVVAVVCCHAGSVEDGRRGGSAAEGLRIARARSVRAEALPRTSGDVRSLLPARPWYYMRACDVAELSDEVIDITVEHAMRIRSPLTAFPIWQMGGAISRVGDGRDGFQRPRRRPHLQHHRGNRGARRLRRGARVGARLLVGPRASPDGGVYVNFLMNEGEERVREAYGAEKYERLKALKRRYDPDNLFRLNQNIPPD